MRCDGGGTLAARTENNAPARRRGSASNVVRCVGPFLTRDTKRREWATERTGPNANADDFTVEGGRRFDDRCTLSDESPEPLVVLSGPIPRLLSHGLFRCLRAGGPQDLQSCGYRDDGSLEFTRDQRPVHLRFQ
jgi:hypothetical protein